MNAGPYYVRRVCCVCTADLGTKPTDLAEQHGQISHTYCPACAEAITADLPRQLAALRQRRAA
jgi:NAD-dependent SIR2 family protein deacetylase